MTLIVIFLVIFVAGPMAFFSMIGGGATPMRMRLLACLAFGCAALALVLRYGMAQSWGADWSVTLAGMGLIWLGWISVLAFGVLAVRRAERGVFMRRLTAVVGAAGTTAPWFGLIWAGQMTA